MKQSLTAKILEHLIVCGTSMMINALFLPYGKGLGRAVREAEQLAAECPHDFSRSSPESISVTLSRLKKRGLVNRKGPKKKTVWQITKAGRHHFKSGAEGGDIKLLPEDGKMRFVIFDVPEQMRNQRAWLRGRLQFCGYGPLQKSVWVGMRPLPSELRHELKHRGLDPYVHIVGLEKALNVKEVQNLS